MALLGRRDFIAALGGAAAWPLTARAQQPALPTIGFLNHGTPEPSAHFVAAFRKGLSESGFVEGQNVRIEYRWGNNDHERLPQLAADLVGRGVAVIATPISTPAALAAKAATTTIPIVFGIGGDPVPVGLVANLNKPGGNITGISILNWELMAKRLGLLHELLPTARGFAVLVNPGTPGLAGQIVEAVRAAGVSIGRPVEVLTANTNREIDGIFVRDRTWEALLVTPDLLFNNRRIQLVALTLRHGVPTMFPWREAADSGGLMSYGPNFADGYRQVGIYVARVLKGEKPGELPVMRSTKFEFVINLQTARTLNLDVPSTLLASADEVIE